MALVEQKCETITADTPPLSEEQQNELISEIPDWNLQTDFIYREWKFSDFPEAMDFVNKVANLAQEENHHPDICVSYNMVDIELSTHKVNGLSINDFILAAKIDQL